jgi:hypothetical protein
MFLHDIFLDFYFFFSTYYDWAILDDSLEAWYAENLLKIDLKILLRKTGARLNFKIALISLHIDPGDKKNSFNLSSFDKFIYPFSVVCVSFWVYIAAIRLFWASCSWW